MLSQESGWQFMPVKLYVALRSSRLSLRGVIGEGQSVPAFAHSRADCVAGRDSRNEEGLEVAASMRAGSLIISRALRTGRATGNQHDALILGIRATLEKTCMVIHVHFRSEKTSVVLRGTPFLLRIGLMGRLALAPDWQSLRLIRWHQLCDSAACE